jgi:hypothetical protein
VRRLLPVGLIVLGIAAVVAVATPAGVRHATRFSFSGLAQGPASFRDTVLSGSRRLQAARRAGEWGGPTTASDGEVLQLFVSDAYPVDPTVTQSLADFMVQLYHGDELAKAIVYVAPFDEVQSICGLGAGGCYDPSNNTIVIPGDTLADGTTKETILVHELGHNLARNRVNAPWQAVDWGTKRWATAENICSRTSAGTAFPGDEGANYSLNPTAADLEALKEDVLAPWTGPTVASWRGRLVRTAQHVVQTPLDGSFSVKLVRAPAGATMTLVDPGSGKVVARGARRASTVVCGTRTLAIVVKATKSGAFSATYAAP